MSRRRMRWIALGMTACSVWTAYAVTYGWTAGAANDYWDSNANWSPLSYPATYPSSASDDAVISNTSSGDDIQLITVTIDDITISDDVSFTPKSGTPTLTVDSFTISAGSSAVTMTITGSTIQTAP